MYIHKGEQSIIQVVKLLEHFMCKADKKSSYVLRFGDEW